MLYLDLDGVFADFETAVFAKTGLMFKHGNGSRIFEILQDTPQFFRTLMPLPCSRAFFEDLVAIDPDNCAILTAMPKPTGHFVTTAEDKKWWVKTFLSDTIPVICTPGWQGKLKFVKSENDILIDDAFRNVDAWRQKGGTGIWHWGWQSNNHTINQLREVLDK